MLGDILTALLNPDSAEDALAALGQTETLDRVVREAAAMGIPAGELVGMRVRQILEYSEEDVWFDFLTQMSASHQPGAAVMQALLARAFPAEGDCGSRRFASAAEHGA